MSLLRQESGQEIDDAARGESFTKGSSHLVTASLIAVLLVSLVVFFYAWTGQKRPVISGEIVQVWAHPRHVQTSGFDAGGAAMAVDSFDQVLVFAHVKLENQTKDPLFLQDILANASLGDGILSVSAGNAAQFEEVFIAYPELAALHTTALPPRITIAPGEKLDGTAFWAVRLTKQEWDARKDLNFTFKFQYQNSVTLAPHTAVIEQ
jgi:erythromycin esterase-like protein